MVAALAPAADFVCSTKHFITKTLLLYKIANAIYLPLKKRYKDKDIFFKRKRKNVHCLTKFNII
jgi:hypothetical protein